MIKQVITIQGIGVAVWRGGFGRGKIRRNGEREVEKLTKEGNVEQMNKEYRMTKD